MGELRVDGVQQFVSRGDGACSSRNNFTFNQQ